MEILSQLWFILGFLAAIHNFLPPQFFSFLHSLYDSFSDYLTPYACFEIPEFNGYCGVDVNRLYRQVNLYLSSINAVDCRRLTLSRSSSSHRISCSVAPDHTVHDCYAGHRLSWMHRVDTGEDSTEERRSFVLSLPKHRQPALLSPYLNHVTKRAEELERASSERRLFTNDCEGWCSFDSGWSSVAFRHPSTFETLAVEPELKSRLADDLTAFAEGKEFYRRIGRAWKRGYLLYGPPGSGKSSLIAAMANFLRYDVYDLELGKIADNSELKALLMQTANRSIIVIEDVDCSIDLTSDRLTTPARKLSPTGTTVPLVGKALRGDEMAEEEGRVTLSGLLSFTDGLWSCCGEERIMIFTTNQFDAVNPALLRCGRMDVHISLGTCGVHAFKLLVKNYLGLDSHALFNAAENCLLSGGALTPAQVGEILLRNRRDADAAVQAVVSAMWTKISGDDGADAVEGRLQGVAGEIWREEIKKGVEYSSEDNWEGK